MLSPTPSQAGKETWPPACLHAGSGAAAVTSCCPRRCPGPCSPGPVTANPASSMGRQVLSTKSSTGCPGFGSSKRLADHASDVPGPGEQRGRAGQGWACQQTGLAAWCEGASCWPSHLLPCPAPVRQARTMHDGAPSCGDGVCWEGSLVGSCRSRRRAQRTLDWVVDSHHWPWGGSGAI